MKFLGLLQKRENERKWPHKKPTTSLISFHLFKRFEDYFYRFGEVSKLKKQIFIPFLPSQGLLGLVVQVPLFGLALRVLKRPSPHLGGRIGSQRHASQCWTTAASAWEAPGYLPGLAAMIPAILPRKAVKWGVSFLRTGGPVDGIFQAPLMKPLYSGVAIRKPS